jgi:hypothetical protein
MHIDPIMALAFFQSSGQAFFQSLWSSNFSAVSGWFGSGGAITVAADGILSVLLILGVYEVFGRGGSYSELLMLMAKVAMCAFLIENWTAFFSDITTNGAFALANSIASKDFYASLWSNYLALVKSNFGTLSPLDMGKDVILLVNGAAVLVASVVYWLAYYLLTFLFTVWGLALYAIGPLLVAMIPSSFAGAFGKGYLKGLMQWLSWPILYAAMGKIVSGLASQTGWDYTNGVNILTTSAIIAVFAVALIFVPVIAHMVIAGEFAGTVGVMLGRIADAAGAANSLSNAVSGGSGSGSGASSSGGGGSASASSGSGGYGGGSPAVRPPTPTPAAAGELAAKAPAAAGVVV